MLRKYRDLAWIAKIAGIAIIAKIYQNTEPFVYAFCILVYACIAYACILLPH